MPAPNPKCFHLSASSIKAFKACPQRFRLAYREGIRKAEDTDALRIGTNWHSLHEVYRNALWAWTHPEIGTPETADEAAWEAVIKHLNDAYEERNPHKTPDEWATERQQLLTSFAVYIWYYQHDDIQYLDQEFAFDLPLYEPRTKMPLPLTEVVRVGKIDHIVRWQGVVGPIERKSTTRDIAVGAEYWRDKQKDTQVSMYALAFRDALRAGEFSIDVKAERIGNTIYDVWRRPTTKPKKLSQKDTAAFIESKTYFDQEFEVADLVDDNAGVSVVVDGVNAEVELGKSGNPAIRETVEMYGARLMHDMTEDPERYFQRQEIARTARDLDRFEHELYNIYQAQRMMDNSNTYYENEQQCRATFPCPYIDICFGCGADKVCDGETVPNGYRRIFVLPTDTLEEPE